MWGARVLWEIGTALRAILANPRVPSRNIISRSSSHVSLEARQVARYYVGKSDLCDNDCCVNGYALFGRSSHTRLVGSFTSQMVLAKKNAGCGR